MKFLCAQSHLSVGLLTWDISLFSSFLSSVSGGLMSVFLMGCFDPATKRWKTVCKVGNGFDDPTIAKLQKQLKMVKIFKVSAFILMLHVHAWLSPCLQIWNHDNVASDDYECDTLLISSLWCSFAVCKGCQQGPCLVGCEEPACARLYQCWSEGECFKMDACVSEAHVHVVPVCLHYQMLCWTSVVWHMNLTCHSSIPLP